MISISERIDGKYIVTNRLGGGGFGEVFLAGDEAIPGRKLALKVLSNRSAGDHSDLIWEMRALSRLNHPGIVAFHHHVIHEGQLVLVMEYCGGGSLDDILYSGRAVTHDDVFGWGSVLCDTLAFAHSNGIVHHDIKPANILFARDGMIKLGDFGVANRNTGTRMYMPPEMLLGESVSKMDARVDIYSLGMTLLEALMGAHPFESLSPPDALKASITHEFISDTLPRWVTEIVLKATHPTPELRFQNMGEFGESIRGKHAPHVFGSNRIKAHVLAQKAEAHLSRKRWQLAEKLALQALMMSPDSAAALVAAGRCQLFVRRLDKARDYFSRALSINPRIHVQKELGWLNLEEGQLPVAISMLSDHLDRHASDFEAYNLLLKCYFLSERYEAGERLARLMIKESGRNDCFGNNLLLCRMMNGLHAPPGSTKVGEHQPENPFTRHNLAVARERPRSWEKDGTPLLRDKIVFQEYRFGEALNSKKSNKLSLTLPGSSPSEMDSPLISIGSLSGNDVVLKESQVSRRHAVIVNFPNEVWLYDLGSTFGTRLDNEPVCGRMILDGVHRISMGSTTIEVAARSDLLV